MAGETIKIDIMMAAQDKTGPAFNQVQQKLSRFEMSMEKTMRQLQRMTKTRLEMVIYALDMATPILNSIVTRVKRVTDGIYFITIKVLDLATGELDKAAEKAGTSAGKKFNLSFWQSFDSDKLEVNADNSQQVSKETTKQINKQIVMIGGQGGTGGEKAKPSDPFSNFIRGVGEIVSKLPKYEEPKPTETVTKVNETKARLETTSPEVIEYSAKIEKSKLNIQEAQSSRKVEHQSIAAESSSKVQEVKSSKKLDAKSIVDESSSRVQEVKSSKKLEARSIASESSAKVHDSGSLITEASYKVQKPSTTVLETTSRTEETITKVAKGASKFKYGKVLGAIDPAAVGEGLINVANAESGAERAKAIGATAGSVLGGIAGTLFGGPLAPLAAAAGSWVGEKAGGWIGEKAYGLFGGKEAKEPQQPFPQSLPAGSAAAAANVTPIQVNIQSNPQYTLNTSAGADEVLKIIQESQKTISDMLADEIAATLAKIHANMPCGNQKVAMGH